MLQSTQGAFHLNLMLPVTIYKGMWELTFVPDQGPLPLAFRPHPTVASISACISAAQNPQPAGHTLVQGKYMSLLSPWNWKTNWNSKLWGSSRSNHYYFSRTSGLNFGTVIVFQAPSHFLVERSAPDGWTWLCLQRMVLGNKSPRTSLFGQRDSLMVQFLKKKKLFHSEATKSFE